MIRYSSTRKPTVAQLQDLYQFAWWTKGRRNADVAKLLKHPQVFLTAWDGNLLVGFARVLTDFTYRAIIADVIVRPGATSRGIGSALVHKAVKDNRLKSVAGFWLYTTDKQAFYEKLGFGFSPQHLMILRTGKGPKPPKPSKR
jgi:N-acetylglutamate synthase-like GNAT family acetyltransferase